MRLFFPLVAIGAVTALPTLAAPPPPVISRLEVGGASVVVTAKNLHTDAYYTLLASDSLRSGLKPLSAVRATAADAANGKMFSAYIGSYGSAFVAIRADDGLYSDGTGASVWKPSQAAMSYREGMQLEKVYGYTMTSGNTYTQQVCVFSMKPDGVNSKLVTWAMMSSASEYTRGSIATIAKNYEAKHPGWIVVGGINADQYFAKFGGGLGLDGSAYFQPQPYYSYVADYGKRFTVNLLGTAFQVVGFKNDGSVNGLVTSSGGGGSYALSIVDSNNQALATYAIAGINTSPAAGKATVWTAVHDTASSTTWIPASVTTANALFIVDGEVAHLSNSSGYTYTDGTAGRDSFFGLGTIASVTSGSVSVPAGRFAIETANSSLSAALSAGMRVRVEQRFANAAMNVVESGSGYHSEHIVAGVEQTAHAADSYNTMHYSRSLFGMKSDGTYCLITADIKNGYGGLTYTECNALAKAYDLQYLYQDDGGGSVTAILRNASGGLDIVNTPRDGSARSVWSGLFFVVRSK